MHFLLTALKSPLEVPELRVAYTGTHDNDTTLGWWSHQHDAVQRFTRDLAERAGIAEEDPAWLLIELALRSPAVVAIVPAQDLLSLGSEARMNTPGRESGNWSWRLEPGRLDAELAARLRHAAQANGRAA